MYISDLLGHTVHADRARNATKKTPRIKEKINHILRPRPYFTARAAVWLSSTCGDGEGVMTEKFPPPLYTAFIITLLQSTNTITPTPSYLLQRRPSLRGPAGTPRHPPSFSSSSAAATHGSRTSAHDKFTKVCAAVRGRNSKRSEAAPDTKSRGN